MSISFSEAVGTSDKPGANPHRDDAPSYLLNCQSVVVAFELRCRGYDVEAKPWGSLANQLSQEPWAAFIDPDTGISPALYDVWPDTPRRELRTPDHFALLWLELCELLTPGERYALGWNWLGVESGHIVNVLCTGPNDLMLIDAQAGVVEVNKVGFCDYFGKAVGVEGIKDVAFFQTSGMDIDPAYKGVLRPAGTLDCKPTAVGMSNIDKAIKRTLESRLSLSLAV